MCRVVFQIDFLFEVLIKLIVYVVECIFNTYLKIPGVIKQAINITPWLLRIAGYNRMAIFEVSNFEIPRNFESEKFRI